MTSISYEETSLYQLSIMKQTIIDCFEEVKDAEAAVVIWRQLKLMGVRHATRKLAKAIERFLAICAEHRLEPQL